MTKGVRMCDFHDLFKRLSLLEAPYRYTAMPISIASDISPSSFEDCMLVVTCGVGPCLPNGQPNQRLKRAFDLQHAACGQVDVADQPRWDGAPGNGFDFRTAAEFPYALGIPIPGLAAYMNSVFSEDVTLNLQGGEWDTYDCIESNVCLALVSKTNGKTVALNAKDTSVRAGWDGWSYYIKLRDGAPRWTPVADPIEPTSVKVEDFVEVHFCCTSASVLAFTLQFVASPARWSSWVHYGAAGLVWPGPGPEHCITSQGDLLRFLPWQ